MPKGSNLNPTDLLKSINITPTAVITPVQGGMDTALWRVEHGGVRSVLRVFRPNQELRCEREMAAMVAACRAGVPVPEIRARGSWKGRPFLLLSWCEGETVGSVLQRRPWRVFAVGRAFGRMQARIHQIAAPEAFDEGPLDWIKWAGAADGALVEGLRELSRPSPALLHFDYHPLNVLTDGREITAVLDWANTGSGDPRADFGRTYTILMVEPYTPGRQPLVLSLMRRLLTRSWRRGYEEVSGELPDMAWFYVWAGSVMAADLGDRVADPKSWWGPEHIEEIWAWTAEWQRRAENLA